MSSHFKLLFKLGFGSLSPLHFPMVVIRGMDHQQLKSGVIMHEIIVDYGT